VPIDDDTRSTIYVHTRDRAAGAVSDGALLGAQRVSQRISCIVEWR
jgi:hypothetical protein